MRRWFVAIARNMLRLLGLARASDVRTLSAEVSSLRARVKEMREAVGKARGDAATWQARAEKLTTNAEALTEEIARQQSARHESERELAKRARRLDETGRELERCKAKAEEGVRWKHRLGKTLQEIQELKTSIDDGDRAVQLSREQLMAIEVKLDIVEGAINVLDLRTRNGATVRAGDYPSEEPTASAPRADVTPRSAD